MEHLPKLLDPTRRGLLKLSGNALKIWMCHWMHENMLGESWPSIDTICEETDLSHNTVETWRAWLIRFGWLQKVDAKQPRRPDGRFDIPVMTVKDGSKQGTVPQKLLCGVGSIESTTSSVPQNTVPQNLGSEGLRLGSGSSSVSSSPSGSSSASIYPACGGMAGGDETPGKESKPQTKTNGSRKSLAPDGSTWSEWDAHDQVRKTQKLIELGVTKPGAGMSARPKEEKATPKPKSGLPHWCDGGGLECDTAAHNQVGDRWLCDPCYRERDWL